jgi:hypothetical protein
MRLMYTSTLMAFLLVASSAPAIAATNTVAEVRIADDEVARQTDLTRQAVQQGDPATIAVARAKLQAAQAAAWGKRHPAQAPAPRVGVN